MTETSDAERLRWEQVLWPCPACDEPALSPLGTRNKPSGWRYDDETTVEDVADTPRRLECSSCETVFNVGLVPVDRVETDRCPSCEGNLVMGGEYGSTLECEECGEWWEIAERSWLVRADE